MDIGQARHGQKSRHSNGDGNHCRETTSSRYQARPAQIFIMELNEMTVKRKRLALFAIIWIALFTIANQIESGNSIAVDLTIIICTAIAVPASRSLVETVFKNINQ